MSIATPQREVGYAYGGPAWTWWDALTMNQETTPELQWPQANRVFNAMRRQDAQVGSVLKAVTLPIRRTVWRIDGTGCRDEVTAWVAADLALPVVGQGNDVPAIRARSRFSFAEHLRMALLMLPFGHMYFEQKYEWDQDRGLWHLRKLGERMPASLSKINVARDGGLVSIEQYGVDRPIPVGRLVAYVLDREGGNWLGQSILRSAYKNWLLKDAALRTWAQTIERNGMGVPVYTNPNGETDMTKGLRITTSLRAGDNSGTSLPAGGKLELMGVTGELADAMAFIRYQDEQIARAVLAHFLNLGTSGVGSYAQSTVQSDFFTSSLQATAMEVATTATRHVIEDLVDINWGPDEPAPRIVFDEIGSRRDATAEAIKVLRDAGVLTTDEELEDFVRTSYSLPAKPKGAPAPTTEPEEAA